MLKRGNKGMFFLFLVFASCSNESKKRLDFFEMGIDSAQQIEDSKIVHQLATDTVRKWINLKLKYFYYLNESKNRWRIDQYVFFNSGFNRCVLNMPIRGDVIEGGSDSVTILLGEKINGRWWFYCGPQYAVLRGGSYSSDTKNPLPLDFLTHRARVNALSWYYIDRPTGACLKKFFSEGYDSYKKCSEEKYLINDEYFETGFNWEVDRKGYPDFLKNKYEPDTVRLNQ